MIELFRRIMRLPPGASSVSDPVDSLHATIAIASALVGLVLAMYAFRLVRRHRRRSATQLTERTAASMKQEAAIIGLVTFVFLAFWVVGFSQYGDMTSPPADAELITVDAKQWMWRFGYPDGRATEDVLTVPAGKPIKLVMTSRDVIHSFYVPAFRVKQDVVPGRPAMTWFTATKPGTYRIFCAEYCGVSHSAMLGSVVVLSPEEYAKWKGAPNVSPVEHGKEVAMRRGCVACHSLDGKPTVGPSFRGLYGSERTLTDGRKILADDEYLTRALMEPNADVVAGFPAGMPTYQGVLDPTETAALLELLRGLK